MRRYLILMAALVIQVILGGVYAWGVFVPPLQSIYGLAPWQTQAIYGANVGGFTLAMVLGGRLMEKLGPRLITTVGGVLYAAGWLMAGCSGGRFVVLGLGVGLVMGTGIAFGYVSLLTTCVKWFPRQKGLVAGLTMAGFGSGAILLSLAAEEFLRGGMDVLTFFRWLAVVGGVAVVVSAQVLSVPRGTPTPAPEHLTAFRSLVRKRSYWALVVGLMAGTFGGQLVAGNLKVIGLSQGLGEWWATIPISAFAAGSATGRIAWGWFHDRLGRNTVPAALVLQASAILLLRGCGLLGGAGLVGPLFCLSAAMVGFSYGANFVLYAAEVAHAFGVHSVSRVYPLVFLFYALSGTTGPLVGGWVYQISSSYTTSLVLASALAALGAAVHAGLRGKAQPAFLKADLPMK
jgi:MFS transporter, OFA family, oxalate/formate antiporter